jgi:ribose transport system permease protein
MTPQVRAALARLSTDYGMVFVLLLLGGFFSYVTLREHHPTGADAAEQVGREIEGRWPAGTTILIVAGSSAPDAAFAAALDKRLREAGLAVVATVVGSPRDARLKMEDLAKRGVHPGVLAASDTAARWELLRNRQELVPPLAAAALASPASYRWPSFLTADNLRNVASQIAVIAILAVGMTLVVITGGIDLSVGSLIALSAVVATLLIRDWAGAEEAPAFELVLCCLAGIVVAGLAGLFSGGMVTFFTMPPFIVTLAMMLVARGLSYNLTDTQSVYQVPESFVWLGREADLLGVPNAVVLMAILYLLAHVLLTRMTLGRYIYAVGGNPEAARLSGVPVWQVLLFVYTVCGALAGLGGVVMASQLRSGSPTYGLEYELYVIAAVVVGGTSLRGGQGHVLGTLLGAFLIAVINNGMNLLGIAWPTQLIILGLVILGAVLLDTLKRGGGWRLRRAW